MLDRIRVDPGVCEGRPTIRGLRITVEFVLKLLGDRCSAADIEYPELEEEDCTRRPGMLPGWRPSGRHRSDEVARRPARRAQNGRVSPVPFEEATRRCQ
jgi:hypothetical protein